jgi:hypothetical protein
VSIPRSLFSILIFITKLPLIFFILLTLLVFTFVKYLFMVPFLIRIIERVMTWMLTKVILMICSANHAERRVHPDHFSFDFIKAQKGELFVDDSPMFENDKPQLILCNHINPLDFVFLAHHYCPIFTKVVMYTDSDGKKRAGVRELGVFEVVTHAMGIKFPQIVTGDLPNRSTYFPDLLSLNESKYVKRPVVLIPECTNTNGRGVLQIPEPVVKDLLMPSMKSFAIHTLRFDHEFNYTNPYNSTDVSGYSTTFRAMTQFFNNVKVQYFTKVNA